MPGVGLIVLIAFAFLIYYVVMYSSGKMSESFESGQGQWDSYESKPQTHLPTQPEVKMPTVGPAAENIIKSGEVSGYTTVTDLPNAPYNSLGQTNSLPYQDPTLEKVSTKMLRELKQDMDGFSAFEMNYLKDRSDPAVSLPLVRFKGDYQRVKDELNVINRTPDLQSQLSIQDSNEMAANLRFLQRIYRTYANSKIYPEPKEELSKVGEGFANVDNFPITPVQLNILAQKLAVEIRRLSASGTTDPIISSRISVFTNIKQSVDDINKNVTSGKLSAKEIPIMLADYNNFLPALGNNDKEITKLLATIERPKDTFKDHGFYQQYSSFKMPETNKREAFNEYIENLDNQQLESYKMDAGANAFTREAPATKAVAGFDWEGRARSIYKNMKNFGLDPNDFGCKDFPAQNVVKSDFSWRGYTKMMCTRLATHIDPGIPEQVGCPPVSWKGWTS
jgi:hypothetical protein